jgi:hypothetical protein
MSDPDVIIIKPTLDELRESRTALVIAQFAFFVQAWRIDAKNPCNIVVTGALFFYPTLDEAQQLRGSPSCILGTRGDLPARAQVMLHKPPPGPVASWTASELSKCELDITLPEVHPWLPQAKTYHMFNTVELVHADPHLRP